MPTTGIITRPVLQGTVTTTGPWRALLAKTGNRVYPYQLGCMVRVSSTGTSTQTHGMGEFVANDYALPCKATSYGSGTLFIPDTTRLTRTTNLRTDEDGFTISPAVALTAGEYLFCLGADGSATPLSSPNYDGSTITLHTDNVGTADSANPYLVTADGGWFRGWVETGIQAVDLLITNGSGEPQAIYPFWATGPELLT